MKKVWLLAGKTGGPILPLIAIVKHLSGITVELVGVKRGFEDTVIKKNFNWKLHTLPEAKLYFLTFKKKHALDIFLETFRFVFSMIKLAFSFVKSFYLLVRYKPDLIITAGSFLNIPVIFTLKLTNKLKLTQTKLIVHQQDPDPGLSNKLVASYATVLTCVFEKTKVHSAFSNAIIIPNPIDTSIFEPASIEKNYKELPKTNPELFSFLNSHSSKKPLLLIFGGATGARTINNWVKRNISQLLEHFSIIHLTGAGQADITSIEVYDGYLRLPFLDPQTTFPLVLMSSDLVIARAGLNAITELLYLQKPAILIPIHHTHQENNAESVSQYFKILHERDHGGTKVWLQEVIGSYPNYFSSIAYKTPLSLDDELKYYYSTIQSYI